MGKINYRSIGQRCTQTTRVGIRCRLPASTYVGGVAVCPYHIRAATRLWDEIKDQLPADICEAAQRDTRDYDGIY